MSNSATKDTYIENETITTENQISNMEANFNNKKHGNIKLQNIANTSSERKDRINRIFCIPSSCSLVVECAVFLTCGFFIAIAGNIATLIVYKEAIPQLSKPTSNNGSSYLNETADTTNKNYKEFQALHMNLNASTKEFTVHKTQLKTTASRDDILNESLSTEVKQIYHIPLSKEF